MITQARIKSLFDYDEAVAARMAANKKYGFSDSHGRLQEMAA